MNDKTFFDDDGSGANLMVAAPLTDRVNSEPPILKGLSASETIVSAALFVPIWIFIGAVLGLLLRRWQYGLILAVIGPLASVWVSAGFFAKLKRDRPDHYFVHWFSWWRHRKGFGRSPFISLHGAWDLGRSMPQIGGATKSAAKRRPPVADDAA